VSTSADAAYNPLPSARRDHGGEAIPLEERRRVDAIADSCVEQQQPRFVAADLVRRHVVQLQTERRTRQ